jgi:ketosteroid isomerase-like protein
MSQENVEIVRVTYEAFNRGESSLASFTTDLELDTTEVSPDGSIVRGAEAAESEMQAYWKTFDDFRVAVEEVIHADDECVVCVVRDRGRLPGSDAEISNRFFNVFSFRDGRIARLSFHTDRSRALEAAGLSAEDAHPES